MSVELDRYVPPGGLPRKRHSLEEIDAEERRMRTVWCAFAGAGASAVLLGFVLREHVSIRTLHRLRRKFKVQPRQILKLVQLPAAASQARSRALRRRRIAS